MQRLGTGTLIITDRGSLVMLTADGPETEMSIGSPAKSYYSGLVLPSLAKFKGSVVRKVGHIENIIQPFLKTIDSSPAIKEDSELTERELLAKLLRENNELKKKVEQIASK